jgi:alkanesulfonate monooxygenase SsuD/methylene tetrahydromethanopterin reductase-like flavin-dependent oxidoreductase (luciferase family)
MDELRVGMTLGMWTELAADDRRKLLARADESSIDHIVCGDHVSFFIGAGLDGLVGATNILSLTSRVTVQTGVYLLPLRHPVPVARQLVDIAAMAPGRFAFGVGIGGEDPHELEICGVDPRTRGRRMDEALTILRALLAGETTTFHGEHFSIDDACIIPVPTEPVPIIVGGRSDAALRRVGRLGDGWLAIWLSPGRFGNAVQQIADHAAAAGRDAPTQHALQLWCGFGDDAAAGRQRVAAAMEAFYTIPFERFEKYTPYGTPRQVADFLSPYIERGCRSFNLVACADDQAAALDCVDEVKQLLRA